MNILFLTIGRFESIEAHSIYADLLRCFRNYGHEVYVVTPYEKRTGKKTELVEENGAHILHIETGDVTGASNLIKKGIAQISIEPIFIKAIKTYFSNMTFDLVMYSTPPITFAKAVEYVKKRDGAKSYLLLKDIFPQNAVDLGMMTKSGPKGLIYKYFRAKERKLYAISDRIGCMSQANVDYVLKHNSEISRDRVEICPNSITPHEAENRGGSKRALREKYGIPEGAVVYLYGGNLGKPQGIPFIIECLRANADRADRYFIICGSGSEYGQLEAFIHTYHPSNVKLVAFLPKEEYDLLAKGCDVGLVFLDYRFTIPNFPSRILSYMENGMPVMVCSDENTDLGTIVENNGFGLRCISNDVGQFTRCLDRFDDTAIQTMGQKSRAFLEQNYLSQNCYNIIMKAQN